MQMLGRKQLKLNNKTKTMAKPIVVLYLPNSEYFGPDTSPSELMAIFNGHDDRVKVADGFYDYIWFAFIDEASDVPRLQVFHEKDYTKEQYDDLYKLLKEGINSLKNKE